jgi:hypothetical protein
MSVPSIVSSAFKDHEEKVNRFKKYTSSTEVGDLKDISQIYKDLKELSQVYLDSLSSPSGNDILEKVLVRATGREPKSNSVKHGADSEDGLVEAKPCKEKYTGHISDDTAMSLLRHQEIPWCILSTSTKDGSSILWAVTCSYRVFDNCRYREIVNRLELEGCAESLPTNPEEKQTLLKNLVKAHKPKCYVRSNMLPLSCLKDLNVSEYDVYVHSSLLEKNKHTQEEKSILDLYKRKYPTK